MFEKISIHFLTLDELHDQRAAEFALLFCGVVLGDEGTDASPHLGHYLLLMLHFVSCFFEFAWFEFFDGKQFLCFLAIVVKPVHVCGADIYDICFSSEDIAESSFVDGFVGLEYVFDLNLDSIVDEILYLLFYPWFGVRQ